MPPQGYAPPPPPMQKPQPRPQREEAPDASAYLAKLATLAYELEAQAKGALEVGAMRLLRQRLTEWVEDLRSVGGHETLADAVEREVKRLSAALAGAELAVEALAVATGLAVEALAVATELARLAQGAAASPRPEGRPAFWK
jgi:uncharacterized membrane-anchored protein